MNIIPSKSLETIRVNAFDVFTNLVFCLRKIINNTLSSRDKYIFNNKNKKSLKYNVLESAYIGEGGFGVVEILKLSIGDQVKKNINLVQKKFISDFSVIHSCNVHSFLKNIIPEHIPSVYRKCNNSKYVLMSDLNNCESISLSCNNKITDSYLFCKSIEIENMYQFLYDIFILEKTLSENNIFLPSDTYLLQFNKNICLMRNAVQPRIFVVDYDLVVIKPKVYLDTNINMLLSFLETFASKYFTESSYNDYKKLISSFSQK
jgi:hypothetical protein